MLLSIGLLLIFFDISRAQNTFYQHIDYQCPQHWLRHQDSCYRFIKSPIRVREDARRNCQAHQSDLLSINSLDEHGFILYQLLWQDPNQHQKWYTGVRRSNDYWTNEPDGTQLSNMENAFLPERNIYTSDNIYNRDYLVYAYDNELKHWGLQKVSGQKPYLYICEAHISALHNLVEDDRTYEFGIEIHDPLRIPRGPYFIKQPENKIFDIAKRIINNDITLSCLAGGHPTPTYEWFKEDFVNDQIIPKSINPLLDPRYTLSGGSLIIFAPNQVGL